ncbi:MAG: hypothetical protein J0M07_09985 [Anaerolineae bacterium]|nr:hypothetical protein [Anaerolineae bacterium]
MTTHTLLENDYATLVYYPESGIVHHEFRKFIYGDALREILEVGLTAFQQYGASKWLSDDRKNSAVPQADLEWALEYWVMPMIQSGWKYWAVVLPDKAVGRAAMKRIVDALGEYGLNIEVFEDPDEAMNWLISQ